MDHRSLSNLLLRIAGVVIVISSVLAIPRTVVSLATTGSPGGNLTSALVMSGIAALLPILVGLVLLWFPGTVTNRIVSAGSDVTSTAVDQINLQQLAFSVLGLYFASLALFDAVYWYSRLRLYYSVIAAEPIYMKAPAVLPDDFAGLMSTAIELIVGLLLLLGSKGISNLVAKARG